MARDGEEVGFVKGLVSPKGNSAIAEVEGTSERDKNIPRLNGSIPTLLCTRFSLGIVSIPQRRIVKPTLTSDTEKS
jgi:hypothetical protein